MSHGLVIGKFLPLHTGHLALIEFAARRCGHLHVLIGSLAREPIPGTLRAEWLWQSFRHHPNITIHHTDEELPTAATSSREVSKVWAGWLTRRFPQVRVLFSSEEYGEYLAEYMDIRHESFDPGRTAQPISGTQIRQAPLRHWDFLAPAARPHFLKRVCLVGPESTGKSVLTERLARHFGTVFVPETARQLIDEHGLEFGLMDRVLRDHAEAVLAAAEQARGLLFVDTDHRTTLFYSRHFFGREPAVPAWVESANRYDLYLFLDIDCPFVADAQRFTDGQREAVRQALLGPLQTGPTDLVILGGSWEDRFDGAMQAVKKRWFAD